MSEPPKFSDLVAGNLVTFRKFRDEFANAYRTFTRGLPNELHSLIRDLILRAMGSGISSRLKVRFTIDANVIMSDSIRVANGKPSTTSNLLGSPYVELFAPHNIEKEVVNTLKNRLSDPLKQNVAFCHAKKLLLKVKKVPRLSSKALLLAESVLGSVDQGDVPYLAVSIDTGSDAILSHDKRAFGSQTFIKRYDMGKAAALILTYHEGSFAIVISSAAIDVALRTFAKLMAVLFNTIVEITGFVVQLIGAIISKSIEALSKIPQWFLVGILGIAAVVALISLLSKSVREKLMTFLDEVWDKLKPVIKEIIHLFSNMVKSFWEAVKSFVLWIGLTIEKIAPYLALIFGVLADRMLEFLELLNKLTDR